MTDRELIEEIYMVVSPLRNGRRERQIKNLIRNHLGRERCEQLRVRADMLRFAASLAPSITPGKE